jgi:hypothetical protein
MRCKAGAAYIYKKRRVWLSGGACPPSLLLDAVVGFA